MSRKSAAALSVVPAVDGRPPRLHPPANLGDRQSVILREIVAGTAPEHFVKTDTHLLCRYVEAIALAEQAAHALRKGVVEGRKMNPWIVVQEKAHRSIVALAARLRLAPQSRYDARAGARTAGKLGSAYDGPKPWEI